MGSVLVQMGIVLRSRTKTLEGSVWVWVQFQVLRLHSWSRRFRYCYCCYLVQGQNIVLFGSSWFCLFRGSVYAGWISRVHLWAYSFVRTSGNCISFHSQQLSSDWLNLSTVVANWLSFKAKIMRESWILKSKLKNTMSLLDLQWLKKLPQCLPII